MPNRTVLNKYGLFVLNIHKITKKKEQSREDAKLIDKARLIALLSSRSWRTHGALAGNGFDKEAIKSEAQLAFSSGWIDITEDEIKEVVTANYDELALSNVFYEIFPEKEQRIEFINLFSELRAEFVDGMEPIKRTEEM